MKGRTMPCQDFMSLTCMKNKIQIWSLNMTAIFSKPYSSKLVYYSIFELSRVLIIETCFSLQLYGSFFGQFLNYLSLLFQFWTLLYVSLPSWDAAAQHHFFVPSVDEDFTFISNDGSAAAAATAAMARRTGAHF